MKFLLLINNAICVEDKTFLKLCKAYDPLGDVYESILDTFQTGKSEYHKTLRSMFTSDVSEDDKKKIMKDIFKNIKDSTSFLTKFIDMQNEVNTSFKDIGRFVLNNTKSLDNDTKEALKKNLRKFGDQINETKKLYEEGKTIKLIPGAAEYFKSNYENSGKFQPDAIKEAEKFDQCTQTFIDALKKYLKDSEKSLFAVYDYIYDKAAEAAGLKGPSKTKTITSIVLVVVCAVALIVFVWFMCRTMKRRNEITETAMEESQEENAQV